MSTPRWRPLVQSQQTGGAAPGNRQAGDEGLAMGRLVMKFGGTSVADIDRIRNVARHVEREVKAGHQVAVVVSAMAGTTDRLVGWCRDAATVHDAREYDAVVASGEQVTAGLLAIALQDMGIPARSWSGWQVPIRTDGVHGSARIAEIEATRAAQAHGTRPGRRHRRFPGYRPGQAYYHLGARRFRYVGRRRCGCARGPLRHLYRCRWSLHNRSAHRVQGAQAFPYRL